MDSLLMVAGLACVIGWLVLRVRKKLRRAGDEARDREAAFIENVGLAPETASRAVSPVPRLTVPQPAKRDSGVTSTPVGAYLSAPSAVAFRLLKTALPGHEIFPRASLRRILGPLAPAKDLTVDFVVCAADFRPVAVVDLVAPDDLPPVVALKAERLAAAGLAYARWDGQALPDVAGVAEWVLSGKRA